MTINNEAVEEVQEVEQETQTQEETQEVAEGTENTDNPPAEGKADKSEAEKEEAKAKFWERQQKYKEKAEETDRLRRENEYLRQQALQFQERETQEYKDPNEPDLDVYFENGRTAQEWSRDHRAYLSQQESFANMQNSLNKRHVEKINEYAKENKDIYAYENAVVNTLNGRGDIAKAIMESEKSPQIVEAIALKPELADELLYARDPYSLARAMIKLEDSVSKKPVLSGAPAPKSQSKGESPQKSYVDISKMTKSEYRKFRNSQRR